MNARIKTFAEQLSDVLMAIEDRKVEAAAIIDAAKEAGIDTKALRRVAKELITDSEKLRKQYAAEEQLDMFRAQVGVFQRKGLDDTNKAASSGQKALRVKAEKSLRELDGMLGTNISADQAELTAKVNRHIAGQAVVRSRAMSGDDA